MKLQLVSHALCPFVHRATAMLLEKDVAFETRYVDLKAKPDWFLAISPRGKVPVLVADGVAIFESNVILEFLDETHPPRVLPEDPFERARQRGWLEVANDLFLAHYKLLVAKTPAEVSAALATTGELVTRFETAVRGEYFAGGAIGLIDFAVAPVLYRLRLLDELSDIAVLGERSAWVERLATRPSVVRGVPEDFADRYRVSVGELGAFPLR